MKMIFFITFGLAFLALSLFISYSLLRQIYGDKDPRKWKPILFSKNDTFKSFFSQGKKNDEKKLNR